MAETKPQNGSLLGKTLYIPRMSVEGASVMAAAYRAIGINGQMVPESDSKTLELGRKYTIGEECYPEIVTLGGFMKIIEDPAFDPDNTAFLMPTAGGPCRFGQYKNLFKKVLKDKGMEEVMVVAPTSADGYSAIGANAGDLIRLGWWSVVCSDALRKLLLQTRPYEINPGQTDKVHAECLDILCGTIERTDITLKQKFEVMQETMVEITRRYEEIPANYAQTKPLVGIVGEIYCRLDDFTNGELIRIVEKLGGEAWLAGIAEWVFYTNFMQRFDLTLQGGRFSKAMLGNIVRNKVQVQDEHLLLRSLHNRFKGYEEAKSIKQIVDLASPYLPYYGALGEMVLNVGGSIYFYQKGGDGIIDISPFSCMNGIVSEAVYPRVSRDYNNVPIRSFYFDGTEGELEHDVEIFLELANTYRQRKKIPREYPSHFNS
jgi:predicted nucleotide-binding protein (sugar kinase/HSP70/actin superfamily)